MSGRYFSFFFIFMLLFIYLYLICIEFISFHIFHSFCWLLFRMERATFSDLRCGAATVFVCVHKRERVYVCMCVTCVFVMAMILIATNSVEEFFHSILY